MAIKPVEAYQLYTWKGGPMWTTIRRRPYHFSNGLVFGLRPATSEPGSQRLIIIADGPTKVHTPPPGQLRLLLQRSAKKRG